jgi:hypothetical protein
LNPISNDRDYGLLFAVARFRKITKNIFVWPLGNRNQVAWPKLPRNNYRLTPCNNYRLTPSKSLLTCILLARA